MDIIKKAVIQRDLKFVFILFFSLFYGKKVTLDGDEITDHLKMRYIHTVLQLFNTNFLKQVMSLNGV